MDTMSRPPTIPLRDTSPHREGRGIPPTARGDNDNGNNSSENNNNNNLDSAPAAAADGRGPPPAPPLPLREAVSPPRPPVYQQHSLPGADMEALLRNWGATSTETNNNIGLVGMGYNNSNIRNGWLSHSNNIGLDAGNTGGGYVDELRLDRSASFDDDPRINNNNHNAAGAGVGAAAAASRNNAHRRIGSTGGLRYEFDVVSSAMMSQVLERGNTELLLDGSQILSDSNGDIILGNGVGLSALHDAARITDWPSVAALSVSNPESAKYVGPDGWNALHHACDRRCPEQFFEAFDALVTAYPEALVHKNDKGWTPLHRACRNKLNLPCVRLLLTKHPELGKKAASMRCSDGRSALHYALLFDAPEGVVPLLLKADPGAVLDEDRHGVTPLATVWDKYATTFEGKRMLNALLRPFEGEGWELGGGENDADAQDRELRREIGREAAEQKAREILAKDGPAYVKLKKTWQSSCNLLRGYFHFPMQDEEDEHDTISSDGNDGNSSTKRKWRILHATAAIKCHKDLFRLARALHPEQALEIDVNDLYGEGRDANIESESDPQSPINDTQQQYAPERTALHFSAMSPLIGMEARNVIKVLLKVNPNAASHRDGDGNLPLHLLANNSWKLDYSNDGVLDIYEAHTAATSCSDAMGRTPLHCVASSPQHCNHSVNIQGTGDARITGARQSLVINALVGADQSTCSMVDKSGRLPLHHFVENGREWNVQLHSILEAHPAAVQTRAGPSACNQLPLHMAASNPVARPSLIMSLVEKNPRAASMVDGKGRLPLHLAVESGRSSWERGIDSIYQAYTTAITTPEDSRRQWTVLHMAAASHSAECPMIDKILELNGNIASVADSQGRYPLHLACAANRSWENGGIKSIFDADPSVALMEDATGLLPFHIAATRTPSYLTTKDDESDNEAPDNAQLDEAEVEDLESLEVLFNLLIAQPSIVQL